MKRSKSVEPNFASPEQNKTSVRLDEDQFDAVFTIMRSIRRLLIYSLAVLFAVLSYVIVQHRQLSGYMIIMYPILFVLIAVTELFVSRSIIRKIYGDKPKPPSHV